MDETKLAAALAEKVAEPVPAPTETQPETPDEPQNFVDKLLPEETFTAQQLLDYLQVPTAERHNAIIDNYILTVYQWARDNAGSGDITQLIRVISEQEQHMGSKLKPNRLAKLAEYIKISKIRQQLAVRERELYG
jgi:hypothetical protein